MGCISILTLGKPSIIEPKIKLTAEDKNNWGLQNSVPVGIILMVWVGGEANNGNIGHPEGWKYRQWSKDLMI